jgi:5-methyltetrahydrofolate--homocysteine methyltransferase
LPLLKEYGAAVIGMAQDDEGIPRTRTSAWRWLTNLEAADKLGIPKEDIIIDVMTYSIGAEAKSARMCWRLCTGYARSWV